MPPRPPDELDRAATLLFNKLWGWWAAVAECLRPADWVSGQSTDNLTFFVHWLLDKVPGELPLFLGGTVEEIERALNARSEYFAGPPGNPPGERSERIARRAALPAAHSPALECRYLNSSDLDMPGADRAGALENFRTAIASLPADKRAPIEAELSRLAAVPDLGRDPVAREAFSRDRARFDAPLEEWDAVAQTAGVSAAGLADSKAKRAVLDRLRAQQKS
ncbi:hypothetical protein DFJ74DRAFT_56849 [Hyaloraphidium curvatum]|nr:hypothetical protein DFJ74DRAFT_56849 [Hyaloraphidium curvatum]